MTVPRRRREAPYPVQVAVRIPAELKDRLDALADRDFVSLGIVLRQALEAGLPLLEAQESWKSTMEQARDWWSGLDIDQRGMWQKRLPNRLTGRELIVEAWQQANGL